MKLPLTRRDFVKQGALATGAVLATPHLAFARAGAEGSADAPPIRAGLVGCGGRGTGAAEDCLKSAPNVKLVALADMFPDRLESCRKYLAEAAIPGFEVTDDKCFTGFDAFKRLIDGDLDLVLLATPPGFRPLHIEAAVDAGKHVFAEKPVAVDPAGVRRVIRAGEKAREKKLGFLAGTQYRHDVMFRETVGRVHDGAIGDVLAGYAYYNTGTLWHRSREAGWSDMEWQLRNWYYFDWLSGDFIVEQHVHTIDVCNWVLKALPVKATAVGGRQVRTDPTFGNIYDHFAVDYEYPGGVRVTSMCRQLAGAEGHVGAYFAGSKGRAAIYTGAITGSNPFQFDGERPNMYALEHTHLIESIRAGAPLNEARQVAESSLAAILGREAAYTGKTITWDEMMASDMDLSPAKFEFGPLAVRPVRMPGSSAG